MRTTWRRRSCWSRSRTAKPRRSRLLRSWTTMLASTHMSVPSSCCVTPSASRTKFSVENSFIDMPSSSGSTSRWMSRDMRVRRTSAPARVAVCMALNTVPGQARSHFPDHPDIVMIMLRMDKRLLALGIVLLGQLMMILDATIVNVALPDIQHDLGFSQSSLTWVPDAYLIAFGSFLLLGGRLGDLVGRARLFLAGIALFTAASVACGVAGREGALIAGLLVLGLGGAGWGSAVPDLIC